MSYRDFVERMPTPPWLLGKWGRRWLYLTAVVLDAIAEATIQAVKARFITTAPDDAVPHIGRDRVIEPGIGESLATYRERVQGAWEAWAWAGTEKGLLDQLRAWLPGAEWRVIANREWSVPPEGRPASPGLVAIDGADWWSRIWVLLQQPHPWAAWYVGDAPIGSGVVLGDGHTLGSTALAHHVEACARIVRLWKAGHEYCPAIIVNLDTVILGTDVPLGTFDLGGSAAYWPVS